MEKGTAASNIKQIRIGNACNKFDALVSLDEVVQLQAESTKILIRSVLRLHSLRLYLLPGALLHTVDHHQMALLHKSLLELDIGRY